MQESKEARWNGDDEENSGSEPASPETENDLREGDAAGIDGWRKYRKWMSRRRRGSIDRSLYTWKGYRSWSEQVKRNWSDS